MKNQNCLKLIAATAIAAVALFTGCKKNEAEGPPIGGAKEAPGKVESKQGANAAGPELGLSGAKCASHDAPKEWCFICDASLRDKGRLWCKEHDRYEDRCWICHPEAQDKNRLWCEEHSLYEDECFLCHPELKKEKSSSSAAPSAPKNGK